MPRFFADYLKSNAGGNVNPENITLLTNETATKARIYEEMRLMKEKVKENDLVIFYFSGHGDKENRKQRGNRVFAGA